MNQVFLPVKQRKRLRLEEVKLWRFLALIAKWQSLLRRDGRALIWERLFKNFDQAKTQIADAKGKADRAKSAAESEKGRQRSSAEGVISAAAAAVQQARASLDSAPAGKGTEGDIEQLRTDLNGADADLSAARSAVASENFDQAKTRAGSAQQKAQGVDSGVQAATMKYEELVEKMRPWYDRI